MSGPIYALLDKACGQSAATPDIGGASLPARSAARWQGEHTRAGRCAGFPSPFLPSLLQDACAQMLLGFIPGAAALEGPVKWLR